MKKNKMALQSYARFDFELFLKAFLFSFFFFAQVKVNAGWSIDLSRRQVDFDRITNLPVEQKNPISINGIPQTSGRGPANVAPNQQNEPGSFVNGKGAQSSEVVAAIKNVINPVIPSQEIVIIQNETGFVPNLVQIKKGEVYKIHILNMNQKEKNVSFMLDSFDQTHSTFFGVMKSFKINPKMEGVFSYQSPETGFEGKIVVISGPQDDKFEDGSRIPATEK